MIYLLLFISRRLGRIVCWFDGHHVTQDRHPFCLQCDKMLSSEEVLRSLNHTSERAATLSAKVTELKRQLTIQRDNNEQRNRDLDALHYVWCDGGCEYGVHRYGEHAPLTPELLAAAQRNTARMGRWLHNYYTRQKIEEKPHCVTCGCDMTHYSGKLLWENYRRVALENYRLREQIKKGGTDV